MELMYFDHAATSWPKAPGVADVMSRAITELAANPGRGQHHAVMTADQLLASLRQKVAQFFNLASPDHAVFTYNCTDAINMAIHAVVHGAQASNPVHVITSTIEHNAIRRPLAYLEKQGLVQVDTVEPNAFGVLCASDVSEKLRDDTNLVILQHASNLTGQIHQIDLLGDLLKDHPAFLVLDAAQTAGHVPIDLQNLFVDMLACSGHKGLLGPAGTGLLCFAHKAVERLDELAPYRSGGSGTDSQSLFQPLQLPAKFEAGTMNLPGLAGLNAAMSAWLEHADIWREKMAKQGTELREGLQAIEGLHLYGHYASCELPSLPVFSVNVEGMSPMEVCAILDSSFQIATRGGLHCNPGGHDWLGTAPDGTVRISAGPMMDQKGIGVILHAFKELLS